MQILQWLFKVAHEPPRNSTSPATAASSDQCPNKKGIASDKRSKSDFVVVFNHCGRKFRLKRTWSGSKNFCPFTILRKGDVGKAYFHSTLNLRRLGRVRGRQREQFVNSIKMKKEDIARGLGIGSIQKKDDMAAHVRNKVLPVSEAATALSSGNAEDQCTQSDQKKDRVKGDRTKTISRMKELLRWAAAAKSDKGGKYISRKMLQFRNRTTLKAVPDDEQMSNDSPKISFRWELESCSTTSSVYSALSISSSTINDQNKNSNNPSSNPSPLHGDKDWSFCTPRPGNWITTDSDFVVLEL